MPEVQAAKHTTIKTATTTLTSATATAIATTNLLNASQIYMCDNLLATLSTLSYLIYDSQGDTINISILERRNLRF